MINMEAIRLGTTDTVDPADLTLHDIRNLCGFYSERAEIAVLIWRICAAFRSDHAPLVAGPGQTLTDAAEEYVRAHAADVEGEQITWPTSYNGYYNGYESVVYEVLIDFALADDYDRIKANEQHMAFAA